MAYGITPLRVWGDFACFTRPEFKGERVSYDVLTPSAARGILEAIFWKPAIRWVVEKIHVIKPIRFDNIRRNEVGSKCSAANVKRAMKDGTKPLHMYIEEDRQQRAAMVLRDVEYVIEARFVFTSDEDNNAGKYLDMFHRRAAKGQCFHRPYLGCREFAAGFEQVASAPASKLADTPEKDLGWMLYDIDFANERTPMFYRPVMKQGVIDVARYAPKGAPV